MDMKEILNLARRQLFRDWQDSFRLLSESPCKAYEDSVSELEKKLSELTKICMSLDRV